MKSCADEQIMSTNSDSGEKVDTLRGNCNPGEPTSVYNQRPGILAQLLEPWYGVSRMPGSKGPGAGDNFRLPNHLAVAARKLRSLRAKLFLLSSRNT